MKWKIIADSACNYRQLEHLAPNTTFESIPMYVQVGDKTFADKVNLDIDFMMEVMYASEQASKSACPSPDQYLQAFGDADAIFVVTITGALSGSNNAARLAREIYLETHPDAKVHIIDSLSAGGEMDLLVYQLNEYIKQGLTYPEILVAIEEYQKQSKLIFVLEKVDNLVKNGRLNKIVGKVVGLLNIRMVGQASSKGELELLQKARGNKKAVSTTWAEMKKAGYKGGRIHIFHRSNPNFVQDLSKLIHAEYPQAEIHSLPTSGICSFYAEEGGVLLGYETL
ncbi:DegV family protein [Streptococcus danieliae]|uniref:DegV family protein n=1 Tax=Streptococcus danieliae TaxID=747656 RepID=A0A7Z0LDJ9_9STRE|nr:DegV family protein [Streptococcus danieliae]MBF0717568.1 DegV family protein [Streptococcus danieliae]NYS49498.1 DegV family protein [Streptococcus danieliae]